MNNSFDLTATLNKVYILWSMVLNEYDLYMKKPIGKPEKSPIEALSDNFFNQEISRILPEIARDLCILDDQINSLPKSNPYLILYHQQKKRIEKYKHICHLDTSLKFREICEKIIEAKTIESSNKKSNILPGHITHDYTFTSVRLIGQDVNRNELWVMHLEADAYLSAAYKFLSIERANNISGRITGQTA